MKTVAQLAEAIWAARQAGRTLDADATVGSPDLATAYAIQRALLGLRLAAGERVVGWKLGYTSEVMRRQMGIARPNIGPLTDRMLQNSGDAVHERLVQPRVEPEIGLRLQTALDARNAPVDRHTVAAPWRVPTPASKSCTPPGSATASTWNRTPPTTRPPARSSSGRACR